MEQDSLYKDKKKKRLWTFSIIIGILFVSTFVFIKYTQADEYIETLITRAETVSFSSPSGEGEITITYTPSTKTVCNGNICTKTLYGGTMFAQDSNNEWTDASNVLSITRQGDKITYHYNGTRGYKNLTLQTGVHTTGGNDYTFSQIVNNIPELEINALIEKKEAGWKYDLEVCNLGSYKSQVDYMYFEYYDHYGFDLSNINMYADKIKTGLLELGFRDLIENNFTLSLDRDLKQIQVDNLIAGYNASNDCFTLDPTIQLQDNETDILDDAYINTAYPTGDAGSNFNLYVGLNPYQNETSFLKFNISELPNDITITNSSLFIKINFNFLDSDSEGYNISSHHVYNYPTYNISDLEWTEGNGNSISSDSCSDNEICYNERPISGEYNETPSDDKYFFGGVGEPSSWNVFWDVNSIINTAYNNNDKNVTIMLMAHDSFGVDEPDDNINFLSKETGVAGNRPYLNITYELNTINLDFVPPTPDNGTVTEDISIPINVSITEADDLNTLIYNWNGTNYTIFNDSVILMMNFDNNSGLGENDSYFIDGSLSQRNGTGTNFDGDEIVDGYYGKGVQLDGVNDSISIPNIGTGYSIGLWVKGNNNNYNGLIEFTGGDVVNTGFLVMDNPFYGNYNEKTYVDGVLTNKLGPELLSNPNFTSATTGWAPTGATIASTAGGQDGNGCTMTYVSGANQFMLGGYTATELSFYEASYYFKSGTSGDQSTIFASSTTGFANWKNLKSSTTNASWVQAGGSYATIAGQTASYIIPYKNSATAGTMLFDTFSVRKVNNSITNGDWHYVVITSDSPMNLNALKIGTAKGLYFNGTIDEVTIYNRTLTQSEIDILSKTNLKKINDSSYSFYKNQTLDGEGTYTYQVYAKDNSDNWNYTDERTIYFNYPPEITFEDPTDINITLTQVNSSYFNVTTNQDTISCILNFGGDEIEMINLSSTNWYYNMTNIADGNYTYNVTCNNTLNNPGISDTNWLAEIYNPVPTWTTFPNNQIISTTESLALQYTATDNNGEIDTYWVNDTLNFEIDENGLLTNKTRLAIGYVFYINVSANDSDGNIVSTITNLNTSSSPTMIRWDCENILSTPIAFNIVGNVTNFYRDSENGNGCNISTGNGTSNHIKILSAYHSNSEKRIKIDLIGTKAWNDMPTNESQYWSLTDDANVRIYMSSGTINFIAYDSTGNYHGVQYTTANLVSAIPDFNTTFDSTWKTWDFMYDNNEAIDGTLHFRLEINGTKVTGTTFWGTGDEDWIANTATNLLIGHSATGADSLPHESPFLVDNIGISEDLAIDPWGELIFVDEIVNDNNYFIKQDNQCSGGATINLTGSYIGEPNLIKYRIVNASNVSINYTSWEIITESPSGNMFSYETNLPSGIHNGLLELYSNGTNENTIYTENTFNIGCIVSVTGQSQGAFYPAGSYVGGNTMIYEYQTQYMDNDSTVNLITEGEGQGTLAETLQESLNMPILIINSAIGSSCLNYSWSHPESSPPYQGFWLNNPEITTLNNYLVYINDVAIATDGKNVDYMIYNQGECEAPQLLDKYYSNDSVNGAGPGVVAIDDYIKDLRQLRDDASGDNDGLLEENPDMKMMIVQLGRYVENPFASPNEPVKQGTRWIRHAEQVACDGGTGDTYWEPSDNLMFASSTIDVQVSDGVHRNGFYETETARTANSILYDLNVSNYYRGPYPTVWVEGPSSTNQTDITIRYPHNNITNITPASDIKCFRVEDDGTKETISSATLINSTTIRLTHGVISGTRNVYYSKEADCLNSVSYTVDNVTNMVRGNDIYQLALEPGRNVSEIPYYTGQSPWHDGDNSTDYPVAGATISHILTWNDNFGLSAVMLSIDNGGGEYVNTSWESLYGLSTLAIVDYTINSTLGTTINWCMYAEDSDGNINNSCNTPFSYVTTEDTDSPQYSLNSTNSTETGTNIKHNLYWTDNANLNGYIFSFDNGTGTLINDSWVAMTGTANWSNVTKSVNSTVGSTIRWCVYANDSSGNINGTSCETPFSYVTTASDTCSPTSPLTSNYVFNCADNCVLSSNLDAGGYNISWINSGTFNLFANITGFNRGYVDNGCKFYINSGGFK